LRPLVGLALTIAALELATGWVEPYGLFHDELYYWACAKRFDLGYVDHPPLAPWVLAASTAVLGDGPFTFNFVPSLCFAGVVLLTGWMAQRFGAGRFGQLLAGLCVGVMPLNLVMFSFYSVNAFEILFWTASTFLLVELIRTGNDRLWLGIGVVAGIALLNKHTFALLLAGIALGVVATPLRAHLRSRWLWLGAAIAVLLALPNLVWNLQHDWPSLTFYRSRPSIDLPTTLWEALELQIWGVNPANVLIWVPGFLFLLFSHRLGAYRPFAIMFAALFAVILLSGLRRADRIAGIYPVVLAAGATFWDQWTSQRRLGARVALTGVILLVGALVAPATIPVLSPRATGEYLKALIERPEIETSDVGQAIPHYLMGRLEWNRFADEVVEVWDHLRPEAREHAVVLAPHWVFASVVEYYGRNRGLSPVVAPSNAYWFWREDAAGRDIVLAVAVEPKVLSVSFAEVREVRRFRCDYCVPFLDDTPIVIATGPRRPLEELLRQWRHFGIQLAPALRN
jgi:4-amino-4-deoxy-L-arabinose transferase-like glycosyltransferase